jgi:hypothetical protein
MAWHWGSKEWKENVPIVGLLFVIARDISAATGKSNYWQRRRQTSPRGPSESTHEWVFVVVFLNRFGKRDRLDSVIILAGGKGDQKRQQKEPRKRQRFRR